MDLAGQTIAVIGRFDRLPFSRLAGEIERRGGRPVRRLGAATTGLVIGHGGAALIAAGRLEPLLERARRDGAWTASENDFLRRLGLAPPLAPGPGGFAAEDAAEHSGCPLAVLRLLALFDIVEGEADRFEFRDMVTLRQAASLLRQGTGLAELVTALVALRRHAAGASLARERLARSPEGGLALRIGEAFAELSGQLRLPLSVPDTGALDELFEAADEAAEAGESARAIALYRRCVGIAPRDPVAQFNLGSLLMEAEDHGAAREHFLAAVRADPGFAEGWYNLAHVADAQGRGGEARSLLDRALAADPDYADAVYNRARLALDDGDFAAAIGLYERYLALDEGSDWARRARRALAFARLSAQSPEARGL